MRFLKRPLLALIFSSGSVALAYGDPCSILNGQGPDGCGQAAQCYWAVGQQLPGTCVGREPLFNSGCGIVNAYGADTCNQSAHCYWIAGQTVPGSCVSR